MGHEIQEIFFLTSVEYAILLAGKGCRQIYTLQASGKEMDEREICLAMNHLYQTRLLDSAEEKFIVREELEELLLGIQEAERVLLIRPGQREEGTLCCFAFRHGFIVTQISETDPDSYKVYATDSQELLQRIYAELEIEYSYKPVLEEAEMYRELLSSKKSVTMESIRRYQNLSLMIEQIEIKQGIVEKKILVRLTPEGRYFDVIHKNKVISESESCEKGCITEALKQFVENMEA